MKLHKLTQGSPDWHEHRLNHFNASDAPAMMGLSKYKSRDQLLHELAFGGESDIPQHLADKGHRFEALARPLAEEMIGEDLYPAVGSEGIYSASFDGLTIKKDINFEHKMLNNDIRAYQNIADVDPMYLVQMTQQMGISKATKTLFMASSWSNEDALEDKKTFWYEFDEALWLTIQSGWDQFAKDLEALKTNGAKTKAAKVVVADVDQTFPQLAVQLRGEVVSTNIAVFEQSVNAFIENINQDPTTDNDFAVSEKVIKFCSVTEESLDQAEQSAIAQTLDIYRIISTIRTLKEKLRSARLGLNAKVTNKKEELKVGLITGARNQFNQHIESLNAEFTNSMTLKIAPPDFISAIKGKKSLDSMQSALNDKLAEGKIAADAMAKSYRLNLAWAHENASEFNFLYANDLSAIIGKSPEDFKNLIESRITNFKAQEADKKAKEAADQAIKTAQVEQPKPEAKPEPIKAILKTAQKEPDLIAGFINSREWPSAAAKNSARAVIVEFLKFQEAHLHAA